MHLITYCIPQLQQLLLQVQVQLLFLVQVQFLLQVQVQQLLCLQVHLLLQVQAQQLLQLQSQLHDQKGIYAEAPSSISNFAAFT